MAVEGNRGSSALGDSVTLRTIFGTLAVGGAILLFLPVGDVLDWLSGTLGAVERHFRGHGLSEVVRYAANALDVGVVSAQEALLVGEYAATGILYVGLIGLWIHGRRPPYGTGRLALVLAVLGNAAIAVSCVGFFLHVPADASIRPMGWAFWTFVSAGTTFWAVVGLSVHSTVRERRVVLAALAVAVAYEGWLLGGQLLRYAAEVRGFTLAD